MHLLMQRKEPVSVIEKQKQKQFRKQSAPEVPLILWSRFGGACGDCSEKEAVGKQHPVPRAVISNFDTWGNQHEMCPVLFPPHFPPSSPAVFVIVLCLSCPLILVPWCEVLVAPTLAKALSSCPMHIYLGIAPLILLLSKHADNGC